MHFYLLPVMLRGFCRRSKKQTQLIKVWRQDVIDMSFLDFCFVLFLLWIVIFVILLFYLDGDLSLMWHAKFGRKICKYKKCVKVCWHSSILKSLQFDDFFQPKIFSWEFYFFIEEKAFRRSNFSKFQKWHYILSNFEKYWYIVTVESMIFTLTFVDWSKNSNKFKFG